MSVVPRVQKKVILTKKSDGMDAVTIEVELFKNQFNLNQTYKNFGILFSTYRTAIMLDESAVGSLDDLSRSLLGHSMNVDQNTEYTDEKLIAIVTIF